MPESAMYNGTQSPLPVCSICIANYNGAEVIEACLESVYAQACDFPFEVIIHDDASTDDSLAIITRRYPAVTLIASDANVGFCISNNRMAARAQGQYILLLNNDAQLLPGALDTLKKEADRLGKPAILGLPQYAVATGELLDIGSFFDPFLNSTPNYDPHRNDVGMVAGACLWIPATLWAELGGFPEWFRSLGEDLYLCCVARLRGYPVRALGISGYRHHVGWSLGGGKVDGGNRLQTTYRRRALTECNKSMVMALCHPAPCLVVLLPLHLACLLAEGLLLTLLMRDKKIWQIIYAPILPALWENAARLLALRKHIQQSRRISLKEWLAVFRVLPYKLQMLTRHGFPDLR